MICILYNFATCIIIIYLSAFKCYVIIIYLLKILSLNEHSWCKQRVIGLTRMKL